MVHHFFEIKLDNRENSRVWLEDHYCAMFFGRADFFHRGAFPALSLSNGFALRIFLNINAPIFVDSHFAVNRKSVYNRCSNAMQSSRDFVTTIFTTEFSSGVEGGHNSLQSGNFCLFVNVDWNTSAIVCHANLVFGKKRQLDIVRKPPHGFIPGVIKNLCYEMVKTVKTCRPNVHSWALSHRL